MKVFGATSYDLTCTNLPILGSDEKTYTYTVITTSPSKQMTFLHDRMPAILKNGSEEITTWLDPKRSTWSKELQSLLRPFTGELEIYPVSKDVGKVGNNSETFIIPIASSQNKSNIANFFSKGAPKEDSRTAVKAESSNSTSSVGEARKKDLSPQIKREPGEESKTIGHNETEDNVSLPVPAFEVKLGIKRELEDEQREEKHAKSSKISTSPSKASSPSKTKMRSATSNNTASPKKSTSKDKGSQKITSFFSK
jgi:hypothetical protein